MKQIPVIVCVSVLIANLALPVLGKDAPSSAEHLRSQLEAGIKAKDTNAVLNLVNWKGVSEHLKSTLTMSMTYMATQELASVTLLPLSANFHLTNEVNGVRYFPNVHVQGLVEVQFTNKGSIQMAYGESDGAFYIAGVNEQIFDPHAKKAKNLGLMVVGLFPRENPGILNCSYVYVSGGKEKEDSFRCTNAWSTVFWGDYIKSCKLTRISGSGTFKLMIDENGERVFDSGIVETNDAIIYEKK